MKAEVTTIYTRFFKEWPNRGAQRTLIRDATESELASLLIITGDIRAIVLAEYDRRGPKVKP